MRSALCHPKLKHHARGYCQNCYAVLWARKRRSSLEGKLKELASVWRFRGIIITSKEYEAMRLAQNDLCKICEQPDPCGWLCVDHDHTTGKPRALLCRACNGGLGLFKDNVLVLQKALTYLETYR